MGKIKGFLFAVRHREILMTDLGLTYVSLLVKHGTNAGFGYANTFQSTPLCRVRLNANFL